jgi:hypothetical protein
MLDDLSALELKPSGLEANESGDCKAAIAAVRFLLESLAVLNNGHCQLSLRDGGI